MPSSMPIPWLLGAQGQPCGSSCASPGPHTRPCPGPDQGMGTPWAGPRCHHQDAEFWWPCPWSHQGATCCHRGSLLLQEGAEKSPVEGQHGLGMGPLLGLLEVILLGAESPQHLHRLRLPCEFLHGLLPARAKAPLGWWGWDGDPARHWDSEGHGLRLGALWACGTLPSLGVWSSHCPTKPRGEGVMLEGKREQVWGQEQQDRDGHGPRFGPFVPPRCWLCLRDPQEGVVEELLLQRGGHRGQVIIIPLLQGTRCNQKPAGTQHPPPPSPLWGHGHLPWPMQVSSSLLRSPVPLLRQT